MYVWAYLCSLTKTHHIHSFVSILFSCFSVSTSDTVTRSMQSLELTRSVMPTKRESEGGGQMGEKKLKRFLGGKHPSVIERSMINRSLGGDHDDGYGGNDDGYADTNDDGDGIVW